MLTLLLPLLWFGILCTTPSLSAFCSTCTHACSSIIHSCVCVCVHRDSDLHCVTVWQPPVQGRPPLHVQHVPGGGQFRRHDLRPQHQRLQLLWGGEPQLRRGGWRLRLRETRTEWRCTPMIHCCPPSSSDWELISTLKSEKRFEPG